ncbi:outer membrane protein assembly factor BamD [Bradyrhizobium sp. 18BD]
MVFLLILLANWRPPQDGTVRVAESAGGVQQSECERDLAVGRYYVGKRDYVAGINRFKSIIQKCPAFSGAPEALAHLAKGYLVLGIPSEAQTAVAVLERMFPTTQFTADARNVLSTAGLVPLEDKKSWIALAFQ